MAKRNAATQLTNYQAKYFAHELTNRCSSDSMEKLAGVLVDAKVDLNAHQVEAALFAFRSSFSKGRSWLMRLALAKPLKLVLKLVWCFYRNGRNVSIGLEREIKEFDRQIKEARRSAVSALTLEEKLEVQKQIRHLASQRNTKRRALFEAQDEIDSKREVLITEIEGKLQRKESILKLFVIRWGLV